MAGASAWRRVIRAKIVFAGTGKIFFAVHSGQFSGSPRLGRL